MQPRIRGHPFRRLHQWRERDQTRLPRFEDTLTFYLDQPDHLVLNHNLVAGTLLNIVPWIGLSRIGTQVNDVRIDRQTVMLNGASDIPCHATRHGGIGAVRGLKFMVYQYFFVADSHADEAVAATGFHRGLLCFDDFNDLDIVSCKSEAGEVIGIVLNEVFGDGVNICHKRCPGSEGWRLFRTRTVRIPANIRPMSQHRATNGMDSSKYPYFVFNMLYRALFFNLNLRIACLAQNSLCIF